MPMNKSEKTEFEAMRAALAMARALRWPEYDRPQPMTRDEIAFEIKCGNVREFDSGYGTGKRKAFVGWGYNEYRCEAYRVASDVGGHGEIYEAAGRYSVSWGQGAGFIYRHRVDALCALRLDVTEKHAKQLAAIDALIKEADHE